MKIFAAGSFCDDNQDRSSLTEWSIPNFSLAALFFTFLWKWRVRFRSSACGAYALTEILFSTVPRINLFDFYFKPIWRYSSQLERMSESRRWPRIMWGTLWSSAISPTWSLSTSATVSTSSAGRIIRRKSLSARSTMGPTRSRRSVRLRLRFPLRNRCRKRRSCICSNPSSRRRFPPRTASLATGWRKSSTGPTVTLRESRWCLSRTSTERSFSGTTLTNRGQ